MTSVSITGNNGNYLIQQENGAPFTQNIEYWNLGNKEVCLKRIGDELSYEVLDKIKGTSRCGPLQLDGIKIDAAIPYLLECQPEISKKGKVRFSPRSPLPYVQRWIVGENEIRLNKKDDQLSYEVLSEPKTVVGTINLEGHAIDDVISYLLKCQPRVSETGEVSFLPKLPPHLSWKFRNKELSLLGKNENLIWELFDTSTKTLSQIPVRKSVICWDKFLEKDKSENLSMGELRWKKSPQSYLTDCDIEKLKLKPLPNSSAYRLSAVRAKKIVGKSRFDPSVPIDMKRWAITLVNSGRRSSSKKGIIQPKSWAGHAALIIEGRDKGSFFTKKAHFYRNIQGIPKVALEDERKDIPFPFNSKRETWRVPSKNVLRMLDAINWEIKKLNEGDHQVDFDIRGSQSPLVKLIKVKEYDSYETLIKEKLGLEYLDSSSSHSDPVPYRSITLKDRNGKQWTESNIDIANDEREIVSPQRIFIQNPSNRKWTEYRKPDNCMTWAKRKLEECGIYLENKTFNRILTSPKKYMERGKGVQKNYKGFKDQLIRFQEEKKRSFDNGEDTPALMWAVMEGNYNKVKDLIAAGVNVKEIDPKLGFNALHIACGEGNIKIIELLLKKGMDVNELSSTDNCESKDEVDSIDENAFSGGILGSIFRAIKKAALAMDVRWTPLAFAISAGHEDLVRHFLEKGSDANQIGMRCFGQGLTLLELAYSECKPSMVEILIKYGAEVNAKDSEHGETLLMKASKYNDVEIVRLLLQNKACVDEKDNKGHTALWHICSGLYKNVSQTDEQIIDLLIKYGANVELVIDQLESSDSEYYGLGILKQKLEEKKAREQNLQEIASAARKKDSSNCLVS